jgi:S1-C subfamily serine protease
VFGALWITRGEFQMAPASERSTWSKLSEEIAEAAERAGKSVVAVQSRQRHASSGVVWRPDIVVTADHTVRRADELAVILEGGKSVTASIAGRDPTTDLAVLRLSASSDLPNAAFAESADIRVGCLVIAVARSRRGNLVASSGILSGVMGAWRTWHGGEIDRFIRPDLTMYPGFSGGVLIDSSGQVLGVNTTGLRRGSCITIPPATLNRVVDELLAKGHIARPYLGLAMQPVRIPESLQTTLNLTNKTGLLVVHVEPNGPAEQAGLTIGDILLGFGGAAPEELFEFREHLQSKRIGDTVDVSIIRGGARISVVVSVGERPV